MKLWVKIVIALFLGVFCGALINHFEESYGYLFDASLAEYIKPIGTMFLRLIRMIVVLLVLSSMTIGVTSIHDPKKLGRVGIKTLLVYVSTTIISIALGLFFAHFLQPGIGVKLSTTTEITLTQELPSIGKMLLEMIPENPIGSLVDENMLQIIVFSLFLGISINFSGEKGRPVLEFLESLADVMYRLTSIVMEFSPIGVFALMTWVAGSFGLAVLKSLGYFLLSYYLCCIVHVFIVFGGMLWLLAKVNPLPFFKGMSDAMMLGFSTASSSASLPVTMHCVQENLGVSKKISSFVLPLGSTVNMNGSAMFQGMAATFVAQAYGINLDWQSMLTIIFTATMGAVGAAGIPGTGFLMLSVVFSSVGLPIEGLAILAGIDRVREMVSTVLNILGDGVCSIYIAKLEGELDECQYYHEELVELESQEF